MAKKKENTDNKEVLEKTRRTLLRKLPMREQRTGWQTPRRSSR